MLGCLRRSARSLGLVRLRVRLGGTALPSGNSQCLVQPKVYVLSGHTGFFSLFKVESGFSLEWVASTSSELYWSRTYP